MTSNEQWDKLQAFILNAGRIVEQIAEDIYCTLSPLLSTLSTMTNEIPDTEPCNCTHKYDHYQDDVHRLYLRRRYAKAGRAQYQRWSNMRTRR